MNRKRATTIEMMEALYKLEPLQAARFDADQRKALMVLVKNYTRPSAALRIYKGTPHENKLHGRHFAIVRASSHTTDVFVLRTA